MIYILTLEIELVDTSTGEVIRDNTYQTTLDSDISDFSHLDSVESFLRKYLVSWSSSFVRGCTKNNDLKISFDYHLNEVF